MSGSVLGVATAANTKMPMIVHGRAEASWRALTTPRRLSRTTTSGIWAAMPNTSTVRITKLR